MSATTEGFGALYNPVALTGIFPQCTVANLLRNDIFLCVQTRRAQSACYCYNPDSASGVAFDYYAATQAQIEEICWKSSQSKFVLLTSVNRAILHDV